jgi:spore germination protein YaaH
MFETSGELGVPNSEASYLANLDSIQVAMPLNGGKLQADGTWLQEPWKIDAKWPQSLPSIARDAGQLYMPGVGNDRDGILAVLADGALQIAAAEDLVKLATERRFDSPWDGVYLDLEGIPPAYRQKLNDFLHILSDRLREVGLQVGISVGGRTADSGPGPDDAYTYDFGVVGDLADYVDLRCYGYWAPRPRSIGPYWWIEGCIRHAVRSGISPRQMTLGLGNFSRYWPDSSSNLNREITHDQAVQLVDASGSSITWIERNEHGLVRERFARIGTGHAWIHDGDTHRYGLRLVEQWQLKGTTLFSPGMGDHLHWQVLWEWLNRA